MSNKSHKNNPKSKAITKETVIIAGLICFIAGYAAHSLVVSYNNFGTSPQVQQQVSQQNLNNSEQTAAPAPQQADDAVLLKKVDENPDDLDSWIQLGNLYFDTGNNEKAITAYKKALDIDPSNPNVRTDLGIMYRRTGQLSEAIQSFKKAREFNPGHEMAAFNMGIVFFYDMKNVDGAMEVWKELLRANPDFVMPTGQRLYDFLQTLN